MKKRIFTISFVIIAVLAFLAVFFMLSNKRPLNGDKNLTSTVNNNQPQVFTAAPVPELEPSAVSTPEPEEKPTPMPTPGSIEEPIPAPAPNPSEKPTSEPIPVHTEESTPEPTPAPSEEPIPEPTPEPSKEPMPEPAPVPEAVPDVDLIQYVRNLTAEDEKRLMGLNIKYGPDFLSNKNFKEQVPDYAVYLDVAKEYLELQQNYNYKDLTTQAGKEKFEAGLNKYSTQSKAYQDKYNKDRISNIVTHRIIKKSIFVTNDNCVYANGNGVTAVRGILYFTFLEKDDSLENYENGAVYKVDMEVCFSGSPDPEYLTVFSHGNLNSAVKCE